MGTQVILSSPNYSGFVADITFFAQTGGTISLGSHLTPYTVDLDYYYGVYQLCYSAFSICCSTTIVAPTTTTTLTATPTVTPTVTPTNTQTQTPTNTTTRTQTPTTTQTQTPTTTTTLTATVTPTQSTVYYGYIIRAFIYNQPPPGCLEGGTINIRSLVPLTVNGYYYQDNPCNVWKVESSISSSGAYPVYTFQGGSYATCLIAWNICNGG